MILALLAACIATGPLATRPAAGPDDTSLPAIGKELFLRTWVVDDSRVAGGDGLGPVANARSCAACHNAGGAGGAGPPSRNAQVLGAPGNLRAPPPLFGLGLLDHVSEADILAGERPEVKGVRGISGRAARDSAGRVGRFGWKAQVPTLDQFVAQACAVEVGLQVPGFPQRAALGKPEGPGNDLTPRQLDALVAFVALLPPPRTLADTPGRDEGEVTFAAIGCADCHAAELGRVRGAYTDLLVHDLGPELRQVTGSSYGRGGIDHSPVALGAKPEEWRTPPLWGLRDSGPYLHDGRAATVDLAIRAHHGEAEAARSAWIKLPLPQQEQVLTFLETLVAP